MSRKHEEKKNRDGKDRGKEKADNRVVNDREVSRDELAAALENLLGAVRSGVLNLADEERTLNLSLPENMKLRLKAAVTDKEGKYSLKISWDAKPEPVSKESEVQVEV